jgi:nitrous oxide reductase accessory protein NosL
MKRTLIVAGVLALGLTGCQPEERPDPEAPSQIQPSDEPTKVRPDPSEIVQG